VFGGQATSSLLSSAAVDETEFRRSQPGCFGFSLQGNTTALNHANRALTALIS
jgi:hypothetical protein